MDVDLDFKTRFYNLEGVRYSERKKNFSKLLHSVDPSVLAQHLDIKPRNYLEKIFYVDILIYSKQTDRLMEILTEGNGVFTSRILKQKWFFEEAFKTVTDEALVNEFLPTLSYSVRMKVLKKMALSFNEQRMDNIFERYGLFVAQQFLFGCSPAKISQVVRNNKTTLSVEQLKRILNKDYHLIKIYMEEHKKRTGSDFKHYEFFSYLSCKFPNLYFEFQSLYKGAMKLGRQTTKAVLKMNREKVLQDIDTIKKQFINSAAVTREVINFDKDYLYKMFPANMEQLNSSYWRTLRNFLTKYPLRRRWEVFSVTFKRAYNEDVIDHLEVVEESVAIMFPKEIKEKWAEIKYRKTDHEEYVKYFDSKKAFDLVKEKINVTSRIYDRADMLKALIKNCRTSKDYNIYEDVLKYILVRHRNDHKYLREAVINEIQKDIDYDLTTETFWGYVNQLINVFRIKGERLPFENICQYLIFAVKRELPLDELISQYVKDTVTQTPVSWSFGYLDGEPNIKGHILRYVMRYLSTIISEPKRKTLTLSLMTEIVDFNNEHENLAIDLNESQAIVEHVRDVLLKKPISEEDDVTCLKYLIKNNYNRKLHKPLKVFEESQILAILEPVFKIDQSPTWDSLLLDIIKKPRVTEFQHSLLEYYFTKYLSNHCYYNDNRKIALKYFIFEEPEVLAKYICHILPLEARNSALEYSILRRYSHLALDEKSIAYFKPLIADNSVCKEKTTIIEILSKIMPSEDFINLVRPYVPEKSKLDGKKSEKKMLYEAQCATAKALANLDEPERLIPLLYPFCQGDYLQASLKLLYWVMYRVNEEQAMSFVNVLIQRAVSARKHAVYLGFEILPQKAALNLFNEISTREIDVSVKKYIFQAVLNYFLKNPSDYLLDKVLTNITFVQKNDNKLLHTLGRRTITRVPVEFRPVFVEQIWNFLDYIEKQDVKVFDYRCSVLSKVNSYDPIFFLTVKESFSQNVIKTSFLSDEDIMLRSDEIFTFVAKYLLAHNDDHHFQLVFNILKDFKGLHWKSNDNNKIRFVYEFFERVYEEYLDEDVGFLKLFKTYWEQLFSYEESFSEYVLLNLMVFYKDTSPDDIAEFSKRVSKLFQELTLEHGPFISDLLVECINTFFLIQALSCDKVFNELNFAMQLLNYEKNYLNCFIAAKLVVNHKIEDDMRSKVINALKTVDNFAVTVRCNNLLKQGIKKKRYLESEWMAAEWS